MSDLINLRAINTHSPSFKQRLHASSDTKHAISVLEIIIDRAENADLREKGLAAIETVRAALAR